MIKRVVWTLNSWLYQLGRTAYFWAGFVAAGLTAAYSFKQLQDKCGEIPVIDCVVGAPRRGERPPQPPTKVHPQQTSANEAMLIWTGFLDGEISRIPTESFVVGVTAFQKSLGDVPTTEMSEAQLAKLRDRG